MVIEQKFLSANRGCVFDTVICLADGNGEPFDLTGASIEMNIVDYYGGNILFTASITNGKIVVIDALNGQAQITLTAADIDSISLDCTNFTVKTVFSPGSELLSFSGWEFRIYPN